MLIDSTKLRKFIERRNTNLFSLCKRKSKITQRKYFTTCKNDVEKIFIIILKNSFLRTVDEILKKFSIEW